MNATSVVSERIAIEPVGRPGRAWIELKGSILLYHRESWIAATTVFIPVEWLTVSRGRRLDFRRLWSGILGLMVAVLFSLPLTLLLFFMGRPEPGDSLLALLLAGLMFFGLGAGLVSLCRFGIRRAVTRVRIAGAPYAVDLTFWHHPGGNAKLDGLVARIAQVRARVDEEAPFPVRMSHVWRRPRPYRVALVKGAAVSFCMYLVLMGLETLHMFGYYAGFPRLLFGLLVFPPLVYVAAEGLRSLGRAGEPASFRRAVRAYHRGDLDTAERDLDMLLEDLPRHEAGLLLMVQVCAERYAFDKAFLHCARLADAQPLLASRLQASLWGIKRMHERMQAEV